MKLLVPVPYYRHGGVEKTIVALVEGFIYETEGVVFVTSDRQRDYFQSILPHSDRLIYESFEWEASSFDKKLLNFMYKVRSLFQKLKLASLERWIDREIAQFRRDRRLNHLARKHGTTHAFYFLTNGVPVPNLEIPLAAITYDLYWRFAPLSYPQDYVERYDRSLKEWLDAVDKFFAISQKTRRDLLSVFPEGDRKVHTVLLSGFPDYEGDVSPFLPRSPLPEPPIFYFPSSFGIYKDQLALLKAGVKLAKQGLQFKIILVGKETDSLVSGKLSLSQQDRTEEFRNYLKECQALYRDNSEIFDRYFEGLGYVEYERVEQGYRDCACVVFPSKYEGFGLAISEAITRGIPVICSDLDVFQEQVDLYNCGDRVETFPLGDADALADRMAAFLADPKPRLNEAEIQQRFGHWQWKEVVRTYTRTFESATRD